MAQRSVYVVFSHTNTGFGRVIRIATHNEYNHVSLALDPRLAHLYSFARYKKAAPLVGGFVVETPARFLDGGDIKIKVARIELSEEEYLALADRIKDFSLHRGHYIYNHIGVAAAALHRRIKISDCYICFEFVAEVLGLEGIRTIPQFEQVMRDRVIYEGSFEEYTSARGGARTEYFRHAQPVRDAADTLRCIARVAYRAITK